MKASAIVLLSGGLDSVVSLAAVRNEYDIKLGLTFDYGQKALVAELEASKKICEYYGIEHKVVKLDFLKELSGVKNIPKMEISSLDDLKTTEESAKAVWVANRNGLFVNIAACFAESRGISCIVIGANMEEAATFVDNSKTFIDAINNSLNFSTMTKPQVIAPLLELTKSDILKKGIELNIPFNFVRSCYDTGEHNCGECESCARLKRAIMQTNNKYLLKILF